MFFPHWCLIKMTLPAWKTHKDERVVHREFLASSLLSLRKYSRKKDSQSTFLRMPLFNPNFAEI